MESTKMHAPIVSCTSCNSQSTPCSCFDLRSHSDTLVLVWKPLRMDWENGTENPNHEMKRHGLSESSKYRLDELGVRLTRVELVYIV